MSFAVIPWKISRWLSRVLADEEEDVALASPITPFEVLHRRTSEELTSPAFRGFPSEMVDVAIRPRLL
jgi:hypothetical protein